MGKIRRDWGSGGRESQELAYGTVYATVYKSHSQD